LTFTGVGPGSTDPLLVIGQCDAPRSFPLANTTSTVDIKVNGTSFNTNLNEYFSVLNRTGMYARDFNQEYSTTPSALDLSQEYGDLFETARNPLSTYENSSPFYQGRSSGYSTTDQTAALYVVSNTHTAATVKIHSNEPVFLSPFYPSRTGFAGISTLTGTWTFSDLKRVWSHDNTSGNGGNITSLVVHITKFQVNCRYVTPKDLSVIPKQICWPYHEFLIAATTPLTETGALQQNVVLSLAAINLNAHPQRIVFVAREQDTDYLGGDLNYTKTDTYARINNISINYGNNQGKLSSASPRDLYNMYTRNSNGSMSWAEWYSEVGSIVVVDIGKDIGLDSLTAPSKLSNPLLSANVNITNLKNRTVTYTLFAFIIYEGTACRNYGSFSKNIAVLNSQDVLKSQEPGTLSLVHHEPTNIYGGNFFSNIKDALSKAKDFVKKHKLISRGLSFINHPAAQALSAVAKKSGYGARAGVRAGMSAGEIIDMPRYHENLEELNTKGGKRRKKRKTSKSMKGGKKKSSKMSRKSLKRRGGNLDSKPQLQELGYESEDLPELE